ncbi:hypothetical protein CR513_00044, partial [Mucuna pruriens]
MIDNETIDLIFGIFQTIINTRKSLRKTYDYYDHITKILKSLHKRWRPQVTTLRAFKDLKKLPMEELSGTLKVHKMELNEDEGQRNHVETHQKKIIEDQWKHMRELRWKTNLRKLTKEKKDKMQVVRCECKKLGHFKSKCPNLEKEEEKEKKPFIKKKKNLMATWEDLDLSFSKDEDEEANICLMANTTFEEEDDEK